MDIGTSTRSSRSKLDSVTKVRSSYKFSISLNIDPILVIKTLLGKLLEMAKY